MAGTNGPKHGIDLTDVEKALKNLNLTVTQVAQILNRPAPPQRDRYEEMLEEERSKQESLSTYRQRYGESRGAQEWRDDERAKINANTNTTQQQKDDSNRALDGFVEMRERERREKDRVDFGKGAGSIVSDTLDEIVLDFNDFDKSMRKLSKELVNYAVKQGLDFVKGQIATHLPTSVGLMGPAPRGGAAGVFGPFMSGILKGLGIFHSGGVIPNGGSYSLGGTQEQLAILKGGERVLSPGENVQYQSGASSQPIVVNNNFVVKAWDSKDVAQYFKDNKNLLNSITFEAIKSNNNQLRSLISNL